MTRYGFHASHEQISPAVLLRDVQHAERAGFDMAMCSDHFSPWSERQGQSAFAWSWLGAALQATSLPFGVVNAPGQRYHPAIIAQAASTLSAMYPGRFWAALGTGEASNEHITGEIWPRKDVRNARLRECDYGILNGRPVSEVEAVRAGHMDEPFPGGESYRQVVERTRSLLRDLEAAWDGSRVLLIGHSANRWALDHLLLGEPLEELVAAPFDWREGWEYVLGARAG